MAKHSINKKDQREIKAEAQRLANGHKVEGQSKEHTKLIAQGIQKGIEQYLREHSEKSRQLDKQVKKLKKQEQKEDLGVTTEPTAEKQQSSVFGFKVIIPWTLLIISWGAIGIFGVQSM